MKIISLLFSIIFAVFAAFQWNDPDVIVWVVIYGSAAYIHFKAYKGTTNNEMLIILSLWLLALAITTWSQMTRYEGFFSENEGFSMKTPNQELAREASGLTIILLSYIFLIFQSR